MAINLRLLAILTIVAMAVVMVAQAAYAKPQDGTRPGWGGTNPKSQGKSVGDKNHVHTGPPGQTVRP